MRADDVASASTYDPLDAPDDFAADEADDTDEYTPTAAEIAAFDEADLPEILAAAEALLGDFDPPPSERSCLVCGTPLPGVTNRWRATRSDRKTCSQRCRDRLRHDRDRARAKAEAV